MTPTLKVKFIQHLNSKRKDRGFTLVELLIVIIIIGILAAVALPNFLNQSAKAKQSEAKQNIGAINRIQSARRVENSSFVSTFDAIAIGVLAGSGSTTSTSTYDYTLTGSTDTATIVARARDSQLKSYTGGNFRYANTQSQAVSSSAVCEALLPGTGTVSAPTFGLTAGIVTTNCGANFTQIGV